jgi:pyruvate dehydrogenase E2 component (dihydrolipoamide acetyltransferase)
MATPIIMPRQGQSVESCVIAQWLKKVGDHVAVGDDLFTYETDKAAFEETSKVEGEVLAIFFDVGADVPCLTTICVIGAKGEDISTFAPAGAAAPLGPAPDPAAPAPAPAAAPAVAAPTPTAPVAAADLKISPRAKHLAERRHADLRAVVPTGPKGRVIERDVVALIDRGAIATPAAGGDWPVGTTGTAIGGRVGVADVEAPAAASAASAAVAPVAATGLPPAREEKHSNIRKLIAKSMSLSLGTIAQLTYTASFDATEILAFRARLKKAKEAGVADVLGLAGANPTLNDIVLFAVSRVLARHPACNASFRDDRTIYYDGVNLGLAVDTPRGLMVPTIFRADRLSLAEISARAKALAADCQKGTISPDDLKDGTFTVSNLGSLGIESFTPVINPPQTAILGVNRLATAIRDVGGVAVPYPTMGLSLTCDHRAVDGAPAARLLKDLGAALENFSLMLAN